MDILVISMRLLMDGTNFPMSFETSNIYFFSFNKLRLKFFSYK